MAKKKNPQQETPPEQDQESETEQQEETPAQETPTQEEQPQDQEPEEQEEDPAEEEQEEDPQEDPEQEPHAQETASDEAAQLRTQLLEARGQIAAYAAGVAPGMVDDAVTLAMAEAARAGEVTEAAVTAAMDAVLKRHPEWKAEEGKKKTAGGFKIGADRDSGGTQKKPGTTQNVKRWNRFK